MRQESGWMDHPRSHWRGRLQAETFDLIVIGGGITGAGIAREASLAGLKTAVLEAADFASGTSSRSTKLIHGGLRYLAQGHVRLVREAGSERAVLRRLAPHLVEPKPFLLPIYKGMQHGLLAMSFAIWLYDRLAGVETERRRVLNTKALQHHHPELAASGLRGGVLYHEYVTDDARLTLATMQSATEHGAVVLNDCKVEGLLTEPGKTSGVRAVDRVTGETFTVRGQVVVNAAGPWIEDVLALEQQETRGETAPSRVTHSRGIHLSFAADRLPLPHALAVQTPDGRLVFLIPKRDVTYVGTTDKRYDGDLLHPIAPDDEIAYLLDIANGLLPDAKLTEQDIVGIWSGVRPLVHSAKGDDSKDTKDVSREDEIWVSPHGLITIAGGKLTAYRKMAERILTHVRAALPAGTGDWPRREQLSPVQPLYGAATIPPTDSDGWLQREAARLCDLYPLLTQANALALLHRYGDQAESVLANAPSELGRPAAPVVSGIPLLEAEIPHMIRRESALHLVDLIARRTELGRFQGRQLSDLLTAVADRMQRALDWSPAQLAEEIRVCRRDCHLND